MAIIDDRLSSQIVAAPFIPPDDRFRLLNEDYEVGPIAVEDMSEGSRYQNWKLTFAGGTFTITPETTGAPVTVLTGQTSQHCSFAFDKNGHVYLFWKDDADLCKFYWYDSAAEDNVITDYPDAFHGMVYLDDKREMQSGTSDVLLVYTKPDGLTFNLVHRRQRDRFLTEFPLATNTFPYVRQAGMHTELRGQYFMSSNPL
jgi:hypothetical protein